MINHLGIIMDGNRRWAKKRLLPAFAGHKAGAENVQNIVKHADKKGIKYVTLWALSTENLVKRSKSEVETIIKLINNIEKYLSEMIKEGLRFKTIGDISKLPKKSQNILAKVKEQTKDNTGITLVIALVYGGQDEIIRGVKKFIKEGGSAEELNEKTLKNCLDTGKNPIPDIIVRTGGDIRHSGFLLFDSAYSEYYFTEKNWPNFKEEDLDKVIDFFDGSKRNFGK